MTTKLSQTRTELRRRVAELTAHAALPRERDLAEELGVSRTTLRQALRELLDDGLIYTIRGQGTFASDTRIAKGASLSGFTEDMRARGLAPSSRMIETDAVVAREALAVELGLPEGSLLYRVERLRMADGAPMCLEEVHLPADLFPGLLVENLDGALYETMRDRYQVQVTVAQQRIAAVVPNQRQCKLLEIPPASALLEVRRIGFDSRGRAVERAVSLYRGDRYHFALTARRGDTG
ncbi:GntR family transcriptional regulator [Micromonospora rubida]|uniref:GntR family transcriptional regulator n=1 Tax=Micromonospora rubida TaxID=2697657 RepID=UPI001378EFFD|nr:GntR family transcriptional regulator [Micromonospora rubida]NBE83993.1 UTRA domain-containing protein [Micromonospora rubida]